ncbi:hypothetical protein M9H77_02750 [Catharanthus roseus]|uniref:Uncharacterized protein n=1 Tax=Catharanthus roseus TaxID=4058 RepID=A0ACC0C9J6_CATRO|nr:hypothetical protein M9H77_02750 [Catharanthus roseus]
MGTQDLSTRSTSRSVSGLHCTWLVPCARASSDDVDGISSGRSGTQQATEMAHPSHRWTYREGTLVDEPSRATSSSSYSLREIVLEREPIPVVDLFDDESVEGPEMEPVAPGIGLRTSIEEDPSEPTSDSEMTPEPERVAPAAAGDMGTFVADSLLVAASPTPIPPVESVSSFLVLPSLLWGGVKEHDICGYCLWREQWLDTVGQHIIELREEISQVDALFYMARQAHRQATARAIMLEAELGSQSPNHADEAVSESSQNRQSEPIREATPRPEQAIHKFRPPEFYGEVEQEIKAKLFLEQLNDIYDTLKYEDALRVTFEAFRLRGMAKDWWLRASETRTLKNKP